MAHLSLSLLGPFQATLDGNPITDFKSNKVRALLAHLAVEAERPHVREELAGLLWPDWPNREATNNLRYALSDLRQAIGDQRALPPFLLITRDAIQFNQASDCALDVRTFTDMATLTRGDSSLANRLEQAVALYRGDFLAGFSLADSPAFEQWVLVTRQRLARLMLGALRWLANHSEQCGDYQRAETWARRQLVLEPWDEAAHRQLMRALALDGRRSAALAQYESCRRALAEELDVEPEEETRRLAEQIRAGKLRPVTSSPVGLAEAAVQLPSFLAEEGPAVERGVFVAREQELAQLNGWLDQALAGRGRVAFVTGEAGSGKTALLQEFARRSLEAHGELAAASGTCSAYTGVGDPYLPWREILELLTGNVEARWAAGAMESEHARRLWRVLPPAAQALIEEGPDLIGTFVPHAALLERARIGMSGRTDWLGRLEEFAGRSPASHAMPTSLQSDLFEQVVRVLRRLARHAPLVLIVDDLQWADLGSINLFFHAGRQLAGSRILIIGAYRAEEVAIGRGGERHPLEPVVHELQRVFGESIVDLDRVEGRAFVDALLSSEPNRLGPSFRELLYRQTGGHPLFTVELLRGLQEQGGLTRDAQGRWVEGEALDWERLPARVEAVVAERVGRLAPALRATLRTASIEGEQFTAEVVARVQGKDEHELLGSLSRELDRKHRLVRADRITRTDERWVSRYSFRHILIQRYLYSSMDEVERVHLHERVGTALEALLGSQEEALSDTDAAVQLALHFRKAHNTEKAIFYLLQAGRRAARLSAFQEGIAHLNQGLELLVTLPASVERDGQELDLQLALGMALEGGKGIPAPEAVKAYSRARELSQRVGSAVTRCRVLGELSIYYYVVADPRNALALGQEALRAAAEASDPLFIALGHWYLGIACFALGDNAAARIHLGETIAYYQPEAHHWPFVAARGTDAGTGAMAYDACCLWCLGYPEQALQRSREALALARQFAHAFSLADVLCYGGCLFNAMVGDSCAVHEHADELIWVARDVPPWWGSGMAYRGAALVLQGRHEEGVAQLRQAMAELQAVGVRCDLIGNLLFLVRGLMGIGRLEEAATTLAEAMAAIEETDERRWEAEAWRLRGELAQAQGDPLAAEAHLHQAIQIARRQQAKSWELRATLSLCRLWRSHGKIGEAHDMLAEIYGWFTEGFDTPDLVEAKVLLAELVNAGA